MRLRDLSCNDRAQSLSRPPRFPRENYSACVPPTRKGEAAAAAEAEAEAEANADA